LIDPDTEELVVPDVEYTTVISLPSSDFQKIIRDLSGISERIEIKSVGNDLIFSCKGSFAESCIYRSETGGYLEFMQKPNSSTIIQGEFSLKSLSNFIKCTPLCSHLEIYLENDLPLIVKYDVASLGEIKLCLVPLPPQ
jgi:proliferating cell nuclear antigen